MDADDFVGEAKARSADLQRIADDARGHALELIRRFASALGQSSHARRVHAINLVVCWEQEEVVTPNPAPSRSRRRPPVPARVTYRDRQVRRDENLGEMLFVLGVDSRIRDVAGDYTPATYEQVGLLLDERADQLILAVSQSAVGLYEAGGPEPVPGSYVVDARKIGEPTTMRRGVVNVAGIRQPLGGWGHPLDAAHPWVRQLSGTITTSGAPIPATLSDGSKAALQDLADRLHARLVHLGVSW